MRTSLMSGAANVAHLVGLGGRKAAKGAQEGAQAAADPQPAAEAQPAAGEAQAPAQAPAAAADPAPAARKDDPEDDPEDDDEDEDDDDEDSDRRRARKREAAVRHEERARCAAIIEAPAAAGRGEAALHLALKTDMGAKDAIAMLKAMPKVGARSELDGKMATVRQPDLGPGSAPAGDNSAAAIDATWDRAFAKVGAARPSPRRPGQLDAR